MNFVHLHLHTGYSLLDGMCRIDDVIDKAIAEKMSAVAITDHGALYGAFKFFVKAIESGIKPIIGVETYKAKNSRLDKQSHVDRDQYHLVLLAKNLSGYQNLLKIVTTAYLEGFYYKPRIDFEILEKYHEGIIALSACLNGEIPSLILENQTQQAEKILEKYLKIFKEDFYLEIQRHPKIEELDRVNKELIRLSRKFGVPLVATNDVHYLEKEDAYAQEVLLCIQTQRTIGEKNRPLSMINVPDYYFKSTAEMKGSFIDLPEAIENTVRIAEKCNVEIPNGKWILPKFPTPNNEPVDQYLNKLVEERKKRVASYPQGIIKKRVDYEMDIINKKGYSTYFLIVQDFVNWAKNQGVAVGPGRGSVAGSLVAYILGITDINPIDHNLPFERFLNPERPTPPDIDIDFADTRREEVLKYVTLKYGEDKVAQIITFGKMEARLSVRDVVRALGYSYSQGDRLAKMIPFGKQGFNMTIAQALEESAQLKFAYQTEPETKKVLDVARRLEGLPRHSSVHAAGVVIADKNLTDYVPLQRDSKEGKITIIEEALKYVEINSGKKIDIHHVPLDDKKTYDLLSKGDTVGVFQLESGGMKHLAKELKPNKLSDISAMVALYRPGPMDLIPSFLEGKKNAKKITYPHPDLKPILEETYGVLVYQEQVMEIANKLAGFSMSQADNLRMAMGKKKKELMKKEKEKFFQGCLKNGYKKTMTEKIWNFMEKFAAYGFNKPHSASYGLIAYWTGYIKANYPVEYMTALLTAELQGVAGPQREIKMSQAIEECRRMEIKVLSPDINKSIYNFSIEGDSIRFGLSAIKNIGEAAIESILEVRKKQSFHGLKDFLSRVDLRRVNKRTVESLIKAGAFSHYANKATLMINYPLIVADIQRAKIKAEKGQYDLFATPGEKKLTDDFKPISEFDEDELFRMEREVIGFLIGKNPMAKFKAIIEKKTTKKIGEVTIQDANKSVILAGLISGKKIVKTKKNNEEMAILQVFDESGTIELVVFPRSYATLKSFLNINRIIMFKGKVNEREGRIGIILENAVDLEKVNH
ncbi:MAG: polymerase III alpha subunit protein [Candidatus Roizmanbacteria bacterium GW2011_GWA2_34_18]|uniref:DNA polymerase III subunit alpha n=1 Tax=Candidatus Roizmanbacteria bacterium GW2011_GWA2_34_18 TaxID=1618477 RepID=A0A0G0DWH9_9BACT|nr:MAG: polymerase III alpha subunit protein [Candidatus Roizmanbacteria bacterium GW2011_GWA2_34_18]